MRNEKGQFVKGEVSAFKGRKHSLASKKKNSDSKKKNPTRYWLGKKRLSMTGENNPLWKGGVTEKNDNVRHSLEYIVWRKEVWKRDNWLCGNCGIKCQRENIVAHHIKLFSEFPDLRFSIDNGITLCRGCHARLHKLTARLTPVTGTDGTITVKGGIITVIVQAT